MLHVSIATVNIGSSSRGRFRGDQASIELKQRHNYMFAKFYDFPVICVYKIGIFMFVLAVTIFVLHPHVTAPVTFRDEIFRYHRSFLWFAFFRFHFICHIIWRRWDIFPLHPLIESSSHMQFGLAAFWHAFKMVWLLFNVSFQAKYTSKYIKMW